MGFTVELAKPATVSGFAWPALTGGLAGTEVSGVDQGKFCLQATKARIRGSNRVIETTGDGDAAAVFDANLIPATTIAVTGHMLAEQALGFKWLADTSNNGTWATRILLSSARSFNAFVVVGSCEIVYDVTAPAVPVAIFLYVTNTDPDELETSLTAQV